MSTLYYMVSQCQEKAQNRVLEFIASNEYYKPMTQYNVADSIVTQWDWKVIRGRNPIMDLLEDLPDEEGYGYKMICMDESDNMYESSNSTGNDYFDDLNPGIELPEETINQLMKDKISKLISMEPDMLDHVCNVTQICTNIQSELTKIRTTKELQQFKDFLSSIFGIELLELLGKVVA